MARTVPGRWTKAHVAGVGGAASTRAQAGGIACEPFCHLRLWHGCWRRRRVNPIATGKLVDWKLSRWTTSILSALEGRADVAGGADEEVLGESGHVRH